MFLACSQLKTLFSAQSDKHQFSSKIINMQSNEKAMRIDKMITKGKCSDRFSNSLN